MEQREQRIVCVLNYGSGNVGSVANQLKQLTEDVRVSNAEADIEAATHLVLPGVGAFKAAIDLLVATIPLGLVEKRIKQDKTPLLGICVGLQLMADWGEEHGEHRGLGWIPGRVKAIETQGQPLPHVGWNNLESPSHSHPLLKGLDALSDFYYVHSFAYAPDTDPAYVLAECEYGGRFPVVLGSGNVLGVQFHPEKSQKAGLRLMENFLNIRTGELA